VEPEPVDPEPVEPVPVEPVPVEPEPVEPVEPVDPEAQLIEGFVTVAPAYSGGPGIG